MLETRTHPEVVRMISTWLWRMRFTWIPVEVLAMRNRFLSVKLTRASSRLWQRRAILMLSSANSLKMLCWKCCKMTLRRPVAISPTQRPARGFQIAIETVDFGAPGHQSPMPKVTKVVERESSRLARGDLWPLAFWNQSADAVARKAIGKQNAHFAFQVPIPMHPARTRRTLRSWPWPWPLKPMQRMAVTWFPWMSWMLLCLREISFGITEFRIVLWWSIIGITTKACLSVFDACRKGWSPWSSNAWCLTVALSLCQDLLKPAMPRKSNQRMFSLPATGHTA